MSFRIRTAPFAARGALSRARHDSRRVLGRRQAGFTLVELLVVISIIGMLMALLLPAIQNAYETGRQNTCRNNLKNLALAVFQYSNRTTSGVLPGYMNALIRDDGSPYIDPITSVQMPVSWAVMILPELDRAQLFKQYQAVYSGTGSSGGGGGGGAASNYIPQTKVYLDILVCPSDPQPSRSGTPTCYVVNTGYSDLPPTGGGAAGGGGTGGGGGSGTSNPRDWRDNGMFFDNYTLHPRVTGSGSNLGYVEMSMAAVADPKDKTILLTENVDATNYTFNDDVGAGTSGGGSGGSGGSGSSGGMVNLTTIEQQIGCIWQIPQGSVTPPPAGTNIAPTYSPAVSSLRINVETGMGGDPTSSSYNWTRPSSKHPQGVNVAFVGQNVMFMRDAISYVVYAKLMSSNDMKMAIPIASGAQSANLVDAPVRLYQMTDTDINP